MIGELSLLAAERKALLVVPDGGDDDFGRHFQEVPVELTHQHHRPFDEARDLFQQAFILNHFEAPCESKVIGFGADGFGAGGGVNHHMGLAELCRVILKAANLNHLCTEETVTPGGVATRNAINFEGHNFAIEGADDGQELPHPAQLA